MWTGVQQNNLILFIFLIRRSCLIAMNYFRFNWNNTCNAYWNESPFKYYISILEEWVGESEAMLILLFWGRCCGVPNLGKWLHNTWTFPKTKGLTHHGYELCVPAAYHPVPHRQILEWTNVPGSEQKISTRFTSNLVRISDYWYLISVWILGSSRNLG